ncbi:NAD(+) synthase [Blattabacterium cuenoti]|uniref:NAD(+) synthase n=1 Tax=Blattabacterium cuenoti TaxID=1653831 RepID=UPI00163C3FA5|nr:NAD(+) synthase [Blattabacterium cuenoti]
MNKKKVICHIVSWLKEYIQQSKFKGFIIGISGGIDSAVTSFLVSMTGYPTTLLEIPIIKNNHFLPKKHAEFLMEKFSNVHYIRKNLYAFFKSFCNNFEIGNDHNHKLALANVQSRIRMLTLYYYANLHNYLVVGTGNKVEDCGIGFFTKYGDGGVDLMPIADLNKSEVKIIANELDILDEIQKSKPTDGLWEDDRSDEEQIGISYKDLEWAMNLKKEQIDLLSKNENEIFKKYKKLHLKNKHKIISIPICRIPSSIKLKDE